MLFRALQGNHASALYGVSGSAEPGKGARRAQFAQGWTTAARRVVGEHSKITDAIGDCGIADCGITER